MKLGNLVVALSFALAAAASAQDAKPGDAAAGQKKAEMCNGCHSIPGYQSSFPEVYKVPKIAGQGSKYIVAALTEYKKGERKHPSMRGIAGSLSDQDMADVAAYFEQLGKSSSDAAVEKVSTKPDTSLPPPSPDVAQLLAKANCTSCHGANFSSPIDPTYPKLAGQYADYLYVALKAYQTDHNPVFGRSNAIMMGMARPFTHAEIKVLAQYISSLPGDIKTIAQSRFR
ncbi:MAG: cytochrome c4 [Rhizobacter sp.]|nr:cytochrome c4 [Rhizobacter sp.]